MINGGENEGTKKKDKDEEIYRLRVDGRYKSWIGGGREEERGKRIKRNMYHITICPSIFFNLIDVNSNYIE